MLAMAAQQAGKPDPQACEWNERTSLAFDEAIDSLVIGGHGKLLAISDGNSLRLIELSTGKTLFNANTREVAARTIAISADGKMLATGRADGTVSLWDMNPLRERNSFQAHSDTLCVSFSPDGSSLASSGYDGSVRLWDVKQGKLIHTLFQQAKKEVNWVTFGGPRGNWLAAAVNDDEVVSDPGETIVWDVTSKAELFRLRGDKCAIHCVAFSPDGQMLASASFNNVLTGTDVPGEVRLWDLSTRKERKKIRTPSGPFRTLAFSPDGKTLATGADDNLVRLWDVASGKELLKLKGHTRSVHQVAFSPDGDLLVSGSWDGKVKVWERVKK
jgi:Tol biopolymer transport system component